MLGNVKGLFLFVLLHTWAQAYVRRSVLTYTGLFLRLYVCGDGSVYAGSCIRTWALTCVRETLGRGLTLPISTYFSTVSLLYATLTPLSIIFASNHHYILIFIFILTSKTSFLLESRI